MHSSTTKNAHSSTGSVSYRLPTPPLLPPEQPLPLPLPPPPRPPAPKSRRAELKKGLKMSSNCTVTRLVRWRVKDFAACLFACRLPLEKERRGSSHVTSKQPNRSTVHEDSQRSNTDQESRRKRAIVKKIQDSSSSRNKTNGASVSPEANHGISFTDSEWLRFSEEEYIVFCFREDGEIDVINEANPSEAVVEIDSDQSFTSMHIHRQVNEERGDEQNSSCPPDEVKEINPVAEESSTATKMDSFESCDSNLSDGSTSSFAFPVLGKEWIGSPVQMPKTYKHRNSSVHLNCCSF